MQKNENSLIRRPPKFMQILAILAIFRISTIYLTNLPLINFGRLNLHMDAKIHVRIPSSCIFKIRPRKCTKIWRLPESRICIFWQIFLHKFHKCVTFESIFDYNMKSVTVRIPLIFPESISE